MADNKMLIDATHPEETRVVVLRGGRVEEFDYESAGRKLLRGNIYLAKVTRVEPALQAAFVDYGGNRHGFLAFNEIHPDYYQIPMADRIALIEEEARAAVRDDDDDAPQDEGNDDADADTHNDDADTDGDDSDARGDGARDNDSDDDSDNDSDDTAGDPAAQSDAPSQVEEPHADNDDDDVDVTPADQTDDAKPEDDADRSKVATQAASADPTLSEPLPDAANDASSDEQPESDTGDTTQADADQASSGETAVPQNGAPIDIGLVEDERVEDIGSTVEETTDLEPVDEIGTQDALEEVPYRPRRSRRSYKIQEVIKRRQILLIQVVKEERGNKGAALTTYLSLAGRYTVLMPNTARGGGVSRKISSPQDRKQMKSIAADLEVPEGMGLIIRTAGASRTKQEIRRDFEYLLRLWESIRELTLESTAPSLVYEEGNLIKRSIRDLYNKDVDEIVVAGEHAYKQAKSFMRMLMPSHTRNVTLYKAPEPVFTRYKIEPQLNAMFSPQVPLKSGGYLVINQTEALVAVDVNSGRSTREFSIEETALHTNLEAADEVARQLKLRDLAGLIVIDFIDMDEKRNNRAVERRMKEALRDDRARIQVGRVSHFGLMEMSRQRMRTGVLEGSTSPCQQCQGTGIIRSTESVALAVLRGLEDAVMTGSRARLIASTTPEVALYILNSKREFIDNMEARLGQSISIQISDKMVGANFKIEKGPAAPRSPSNRATRNVVNIDSAFEDEDGNLPDARPARPDEGDSAPRDGDDQPRRRRRRRRPGRGGDDNRSPDRQAGNGDANDVEESNASDDSQGVSESGSGDGQDNAAGDEDRPRRSRRRGRRGGRRNRERREAKAASATQDTQDGVPFGEDQSPNDDSASPINTDQANADTPSDDHVDDMGTQPDLNDATANNDADAPDDSADEKPARRSRSRRPSTRTRRTKKADTAEEDARQSSAEPDTQEAIDEPAPSPRETAKATSSSAIEITTVRVGETQASDSDGADTTTAEETTAKKPTRTGWWQRRLLGED